MTGVLDLGRPLGVAGRAEAFGYEDQPRVFGLLPDGLELARAPESEGGRPQLSLQYVRRDDRRDGVRGDYGVLSLRVAARYGAASDALAAARRHDPAASLRFAAFERGFLRLRPLTEADREAPLDLLVPRALSHNGLGFWYRAVLDRQSATWLGESLKRGLLTLRSYAELIFTARAARAPVRIAFDVGTLREALRLDAGECASCTRGALVDVLRLELLRDRLITREGDCPRELLAEVLADWIIARLGKIVPAPAPDRETHLQLDLGAARGMRRIRWDLAEPLLVERLAAVDVAPLEAARVLGPDFAPERVTLRALPDGVVSLHPRLLPPPGLRETVGVDIHLRSTIETVEFEPPKFEPSSDTPLPVALSFSLREPLRCAVTPYLVLDGVKQVGSARELAFAPSATDVDVEIDAADLPVHYATVEASAELLRVAEVDVTVADPGAPTRVLATFTLTAADPVRTVVVPRELGAPTALVRARARESDLTATAGPYDLARPCFIDLHSFAAFGHHEVLLTWEFDDDEERATIEVLTADGESERPRWVSFDRATPTAPAYWTGATPFAPGQRVRRAEGTRWHALSPTSAHVTLRRTLLA